MPEVGFLDAFVQMLGGPPLDAPDMPPIDTTAFNIGPEVSVGDVVPIAGDGSGVIDADTDAGPGTIPASDPSAVDTSTIDTLIQDIISPALPGFDPGPLEPTPFVPANIDNAERDIDPIGGMPPNALPVDVEMPFVPVGLPDTPEPEEVVPIAGDGSDAIDADTDAGPGATPASIPAPTVSSGVAEALGGDISDAAEDFVAATGGTDQTGIIESFLNLIRSNPWLAAISLGIIVALAVALPIALSNDGSSTAPVASVSSQPSASTTSTTSTTTSAPTSAVTPADVNIADFGLLATGGQGFQFSLEAPAKAPKEQTVVLSFTGPGLPATQSVTVPAGGSKRLTYATSGCGTWTVRVASIDGKPIDSKGNPSLSNGMTHACNNG